MSSAHVAHQHNYNQNTYSSKHKNGHISPSDYTTDQSSKYTSSTHHKNGYHNHSSSSSSQQTSYTESTELLADSDTLDDMESQSPTHSPRHYPRKYDTHKPNTKSINNHSVRHRLRKQPINKNNTNNNNNNSSIRNRYYTRYGFKKFTSNNRKYKYTAPKKQDYTFKIIAGISLFLLAISIYYFYGDLLTFTALKENHHSIIQFIDKYPIFSPIVFILFECIVVGLTIPGATVLSMAAGLFFRQPFASLYAWCGCGLGAFLCFLSVRYICADCFRSMLTKHGEWFNTFKNGLRKNELLYLIYVRYVIIIPFWFVNVAAALFGCKIYNFILSTFIATIPGALLLTTAGRGLANAFESFNTEEITAFGLFKEILWSKDMLFCILLLLFCLSIPFLLKKYGGKQFDIFNDSQSNLNGNDGKRFSQYRDNDFFDNDSDPKNK